MSQQGFLSPKLTICIPAYNRPKELLQVLASIYSQGRGPWEVVICEDKSPRGDEIEQNVKDFSDIHPDLSVHIYRNELNLGYDANLRRLLDKANGEYCMFMGDDDELAPGSLNRTLSAISSPNIGFVLRAWKSVDKNTGEDIEVHRYFTEDRLFPPGKDSVAALYRRSVFISGLTVHRDTARLFHTDRFDGMLLYQLYLVGRLLSNMNGYYVSDIVAVRRVGGEHFFGNSEKEKERFTPSQLLPVHSVTFLRGLFDIARVIDAEFSPGVFNLICGDLGRYSYPMLEIQARHLTKKEFRQYADQLTEIGLGSTRLFKMYYYALFLFGPDISNALVRTTKRLLGGTPNLGGSNGIKA